MYVNASNFLATTAHYIADGVAIVVILFTALRAAKKGFVACLFGFVSTIASLIVAFTLSGKLVEITGGLFGLRETLPHEVMADFVAGIFLFVGSKLVLALLKKLLSAVIERIPLVGSLNHALGFAVGGAEAFFAICGVLALLALLPIDGVGAFFSECTVLNFLFYQNPIYAILSWLTSRG